MTRATEVKDHMDETLRQLSAHLLSQFASDMTMLEQKTIDLFEKYIGRKADHPDSVYITMTEIL